MQLQVVEPLAWLLDTDLRSSGKAASLLTSEAAPVGNDLISHTHLTSLLWNPWMTLHRAAERGKASRCQGLAHPNCTVGRRLFYTPLYTPPCTSVPLIMRGECKKKNESGRQWWESLLHTAGSSDPLATWHWWWHPKPGQPSGTEPLNLGSLRAWLLVSEWSWVIGYLVVLEAWRSGIRKTPHICHQDENASQHPGSTGAPQHAPCILQCCVSRIPACSLYSSMLLMLLDSTWTQLVIRAKNIQSHSQLLPPSHLLHWTHH